MNWQNVIRILRSDYLKLLPIIVLAYYLTFIPHLNYIYPVHLDEWLALGASEALLEEGSFTIGVGRFMEAGFHAFWGIFHQISGISWIDIFRYFPGVVFIITLLSVYILAQREGFGWEAAFFTSLIPTTVGILGPAFLVPVTMVLPFIPLALFLALHFRTAWSYVVLFIFTCFLLLAHSVTAVGLVIILVPYILLNLKSNFKHSLGISLAMAIPILVPFPWIFTQILPLAKLFFTQAALPGYVEYPVIMQTYGYLPILLCLLGVLLLAKRGGRKSYGLVLGLMALLVVLVTQFTFHYGAAFDVAIIYVRGLMYMMLMMSIVAGAGLMGVRTFKLPVRLTAWLKVALIRQNVGNILCLALIGLILAIGIPAHKDTPYYHMIDEQDYQAFVWIKENINEDYGKAILDPWKGHPFKAITQKEVYSAIKGYPKPSDNEAYKFLRDGCSDTDFLRKNGISFVYTRRECHNPDLMEVRQHIYLLGEAEKDQ